MEERDNESLYQKIDDLHCVLKALLDESVTHVAAKALFEAAIKRYRATQRCFGKKTFTVNFILLYCNAVILFSGKYLIIYFLPCSRK